MLPLIGRLERDEAPEYGTREWLIIRASWQLPEPDFRSMAEFTYNEQAAIHRQWHRNYPSRPEMGDPRCGGQPFFGLQYIGGAPQPPRPPLDRLTLLRHGLTISGLVALLFTAWLILGPR